jgi:hypothetical protein
VLDLDRKNVNQLFLKIHVLNSLILYKKIKKNEMGSLVARKDRPRHGYSRRGENQYGYERYF